MISCICCRFVVVVGYGLFFVCVDGVARRSYGLVGVVCAFFGGVAFSVVGHSLRL